MLGRVGSESGLNAISLAYLNGQVSVGAWLSLTLKGQDPVIRHPLHIAVAVDWITEHDVVAALRLGRVCCPFWGATSRAFPLLISPYVTLGGGALVSVLRLFDDAVQPPRALQADPAGFRLTPRYFPDIAAKEGGLMPRAKSATARTALVVREATRAWTPLRHHLYHRGHRNAVRLLLLVAQRLRNSLAAQPTSATPCSPPPSTLPPLPEELWFWILRFSLRRHWCVPVPPHPTVQICASPRASKHKPPDASQLAERERWGSVLGKGALATAVRRWRVVVAKWAAVIIVAWLAMLELDPATSHTTRTLWREQTHMNAMLGGPRATGIGIGAADLGGRRWCDRPACVGAERIWEGGQGVPSPSLQTRRPPRAEPAGPDGSAAPVLAATAPPPVNRPIDKGHDPVHVSGL